MRFNFSFLSSIAIPLLSSVLMFSSCGKNSKGEGLIIIAESENISEPNFLTGGSWRYNQKSRLISINPDKPGKSPVILSHEFYSACSPEVSYDGLSIIFSGQKNENDPWQIWEMNLKNNMYRQVTSAIENSIDPAYMPGDRIVFSRFLKNDSLKAEHTLFTCNLDGTNLKRITFNPHTYFASSLLNDGRVISMSRQVFPSESNPAIMVLRPDGTKSELFYQIPEGKEVMSRAYETENGRIIFIETEKNAKNRGSVVSVSYNRPLHSKVNHSSTVSGDFKSVNLFQEGRYLVSYRSDDSERYGLYEYDPEKTGPGNQIYRNDNSDVLEAVFVKPHNRPKKLPSEVDQAVKTGLLLCQNINITGMTSPESENLIKAAVRIEVMGIDSSLGVIDVEQDGSFYLKVAADIPFKIKTLDKEGKVINGPGSWIWLRPNERRGCTGCHEDQEMVPANRLALAVKKNPVSVPVHIKDVKEKVVELE
jgi:hypothetical protein